MKSVLRQKIVMLFILLTILIFPVSAQIGFYEGYIVTNLDDTLTGQVGKNESRHIIKNCILKQDGKSAKYYPADFKRFGYFDGPTYVSNVLKDTIVQVLVEGKLNLYKVQTTLYLSKENEKVTKLENYTEKAVRNDEVYYVESVKWKGILTYMTSDCSPDKKVIEKLKLREVEITDFVVNYNKCSKSDYTQYKSK